MTNTQRDILRRALAAAREQQRQAFLGITADLRPEEGKAPSRDEVWVLAERAFLVGNYEDAVRQFDRFEEEPGFRDAPSWQRYLSAQRRAFALLQLGKYTSFEGTLREAEDRLSATPELEPFRADVDALEAHLVELQGDFATAYARMTLAHDLAVKAQRWQKAAGTASDAGRLSLILEDAPRALEWQHLARRYAGRAASTVHQRTIDERIASIYKHLRRYGDAERLYNAVIEQCADGTSPGALEAALMGRADLSVIKDKLDAAEVDFRQAAALCNKNGMRRLLLYPLKDLARLYLARNSAGDPDLARDYFERALDLAFSLVPHQPLLFMQLAEDVIAEPRFLGQPLLPRTRDQLIGALTQLRELARPHPYQEAFRAHGFARAFKTLMALLASIRKPEISLATRIVRPLSMTVIDKVTRKRLATITSAPLALLRLLVGPPPTELQLEEIQAHFGNKTIHAAQKRVDRLRKAIGDDLETPRRQNVHYYRVRLDGTTDSSNRRSRKA